ncbi:MAG TPA: hypothetical protein VF517_16685, partial [Thermoleophilaceae bacterium]
MVEATAPGLSVELAVYEGDVVFDLRRRTQAEAWSTRVKFTARAGVTYHVAAFADRGPPDGAFELRLDLGDTPANDSFASSAPLSGDSPTVAGDTTWSTIEAGEPRPDYTHGTGSNWYTWTATQDGGVTIATGGSELDATVGVYRGDALGRLDHVATDPDPDADDPDGRLSFRATAGVTYRIAVNGTDTQDAGRYSLSLLARPVPPNDAFDAPTPLGSARSVAVAGRNDGAVAEPFEPAHFFYMHIRPPGPSVWYEWTAPANGSLTVRTDGAGTPLAYTGATLIDLERVRSESAGHHSDGSWVRIRAQAGVTYRIVVFSRWDAGDFVLSLNLRDPPGNDDLANPTELTGSPAQTAGTTTDATAQPCEPAPGVEPLEETSAWYSWTAPASGPVTIDATSGSFEPLLGIYAEAPACERYGGAPAPRTFRATAGHRYWIAVAAWDGRGGEFDLSIDFVAPPPNDRFDDARPMAGSFLDERGTLMGATVEPGEPSPAGEVGSSVWYSWTAPTTGETDITFESWPHPARIAVHTGDEVDELTQVAVGGSVRFRSIEGTTYRIAVDGGAVASYLDFTIRLTHRQSPANDAFANAESLAGIAAETSGTTAGATREPNEPETGLRGATVWYSWTAMSDGGVTVDVDTPDSAVGVYTGDDVATLAQVTRARSSFDPLRVQFRARAGTTYRIAVDRADEYRWGAPFKLSLKLRPLPPNDAFALATPLAPAPAASASGTTVAATAEAGEPAGGDGQSVWYSWTAPAGGSLTLEATGDRPVKIAAYTGSSVSALTPMPVEELRGGGWTRVRVEAGVTYRIAVWTTRTPADFDLSLRLAQRPANDDFAEAAVLSGSEAGTSGTTVDATRERCDYPSETVWYRWTAPHTGGVILDTAGSETPVRVDVHTGDSACSLEDASPALLSDGGTTERVSFRAVASTTYRIAVHPLWDRTGPFQLDLRLHAPPPNDAFADAIELTGSSDAVTGTTFGATEELGEESRAASVWYTWTAPSGGLAEVGFPPAGRVPGWNVRVYTGDAPGALTHVATSNSNGLAHFNAMAGRTYRIAVRGFGGTILEPFRLYLATAGAPPNDGFAAAERIDGDSGEVRASTLGAGSDPGEPEGPGWRQRASVWYLWTPARSGLAKLELPSEDRAVTGVYRDSPMNQLSLVASGGRTVGLRVVAGTTYRIGVYGRQSVSYGAFKLRWRTLPAPANDDFANAAALSGESVDHYGSTIGADSEPGEPPPPTQSEGGEASVWHAWRAPASGLVSVRTTSGAADVFTGSDMGSLQRLTVAPDWAETAYFRAVAGTTYWIRVSNDLTATTYGDFRLRLALAQPAPNDDFERAQQLVDRAVGTTAGAGDQPGEPLRDQESRATVWYTWTPETTGKGRLAFARSSRGLSVYTGARLDTLRRVTSASHGDAAEFRAIAGTTYHVAVDDWLGIAGGFVLDAAVLPGPPNDDLAQATVLTGGSASATGPLANATLEPGEASTTDNYAESSTWYRWTAPSNGRVTFEASRRTILAATGTSIGDLKRLAQSSGRVSVPVRAGTTYLFGLYGSAEQEGDVEVALSHSPAPANDEFANAEALQDWPARASGSNQSATREPGEPRSTGGDDDRSGTVWYSWTAPQNGWAELDLTGTAFAPTAGVYTGDTLAGLSKVAAASAGAGEAPPKLRWRIAAGVTYRIAIGGVRGAAGSIELAIRKVETRPNDDFADAEVLSGRSARVPGSNVGATTEPGEQGRYGPGYSVWYRWTSEVTGNVTVHAANTDARLWLEAFTGTELQSLSSVSAGSQRVSFYAVAGTTYTVRVAADIYVPMTGSYELRLDQVAAPANDDFAAPSTLEGASSTTTGTTVGATPQGCDPIELGNGSAPSVWYSWTAPASGAVTLTTGDGVSPPFLGVYTGTEHCWLSAVPTSRPNASTVTFAAQAGVRYRIIVSARRGATGPFALALSVAPSPPPPPPDEPRNPPGDPPAPPDSGSGDQPSPPDPGPADPPSAPDPGPLAPADPPADSRPSPERSAPTEPRTSPAEPSPGGDPAPA